MKRSVLVVGGGVRALWRFLMLEEGDAAGAHEAEFRAHVVIWDFVVA
jgi:hypothetical protein